MLDLAHLRLFAVSTQHAFRPICLPPAYIVSGDIILYDAATFPYMRHTSACLPAQAHPSMPSAHSPNVVPPACLHRYIVSGGEDDMVVVYGVSERCPVAHCEGHRSWVSCVRFDPWALQQPLGRERGGPAAAAAIPGLYRVVSGGQDAQLCLWDVQCAALAAATGAEGDAQIGSPKAMRWGGGGSAVSCRWDRGIRWGCHEASDLAKGYGHEVGGAGGVFAGSMRYVCCNDSYIHSPWASDLSSPTGPSR